jgi:c-di-GMP-binding flagellar brake protein YcgR
MHQLFIIIPAALALIAVIFFVTYRVLRRGGKSRKSEVGTSQRREHFRVDVSEAESLIATLKLDGGELTECRLVNISVGGAAVLAVSHPIPLEIGSKIKEIMITFSGGEEIRSPAVVRYVSKESDSAWNKYGVQFVDLSDDQSGVIARCVLQAEAKKMKEQRTIPTEEKS